MGTLLMYIGVAILVFGAIGYYVSANPQIKRTIMELEGSTTSTLVMIIPVFLLFSTFGIGYVEAQNVAFFAERYLHLPYDTAFLFLSLMAMISSSLSIFGTYYAFSSQDDGIFTTGEKTVAWWAIGVAVGLQGVIGFFGYVVHVRSHVTEMTFFQAMGNSAAYFEAQKEASMGWWRFIIQLTLVGADIAISCFSAVYAIKIGKRLHKENKHKLGIDEEEDVKNPKAGKDSKTEKNDKSGTSFSNPTSTSQKDGSHKNHLDVIKLFCEVGNYPYEEFKAWLFEYIGFNIDIFHSTQKVDEALLDTERTDISVKNLPDLNAKFEKSKELLEAIVKKLSVKKEGKLLLDELKAKKIEIEKREVEISNRQKDFDAKVIEPHYPAKEQDKQKLQDTIKMLSDEKDKLVSNFAYEIDSITDALKVLGAPI